MNQLLLVRFTQLYLIVASITGHVVYASYNGAVRLVGGSSNSSGRVEVYINGSWGTVCDDYWDNTDAIVVCRQLGIEGVATAHTNAYFGAGTGNINMDNVGCSGIENYLINCTFISDHNCNHFEDAGVTCGTEPQCNNSEIRLVGGRNDMEGRVEVCINELWGTVCDDNWGTHDATVVCRQLGFNGTSIAHTNAYFGAGNGTINMDDVGCSGNEKYLINCSYTSQPNCNHSEDAGVTCVIALSLSLSSSFVSPSAIIPSPTVATSLIPASSFINSLISPTPTGSCLSLNLNYSGCCIPGNCRPGDCYCDQICYIYRDCCSDVESIGCYPIQQSLSALLSSTQIVATPTPTALPGQGSCTQIDDTVNSQYGSSLYLHICCQSSNLGQNFCYERNECKRTISCPLVQPGSCP